MTPELPNYEEQVYAGVLGKVLGVYMGRPFEGWPKSRLVARFGLVDRYVAGDLGKPLVVADDDITGTFTFIRALEDSGRYADTPPEDFGKGWLNYIVEGKSILWWGGMGVSTEHTAFLRLKSGVPAPRSGSIALNGKTVAEQIGAQIFIDAFGLVAPGDPKLAARLARPSAQVSHDGEAVNGALVVAALVAAAFVEKDMEKLLDLGVSVIPRDCLIAQIHRDVRAWRKQDNNWHATYDRIAAKYGYDKYGGGCHMVPNHALMVLAWSYAPDSFRQSQAIVNTAGWDTDCNAANVGSVMGVKVGLAGIVREYDFQGPPADRMVLPTAEGTRHVSDCLIEAFHIARIGRRIMGWAARPAPKDGAWHHFSLPGSRHGYMVEALEAGTPGSAAVQNVAGPGGGRMLEVAFREAAPEHPVRVSTPVLFEEAGGGYAVMGTPRFYAGQRVAMNGLLAEASGPVTARLFLRLYAPEGDGPLTKSTRLVYGEPATLGSAGPFTAEVAVPNSRGFPVRDVGLELSGPAGTSGRVLVDRVSFGGAVKLAIPDELPRNERNERLGWIVDLDCLKGRFSDQKQPVNYFGKNRGRGMLVTGTADWRDYTLSCRFGIHCASRAGLVARYQGLERHLALVKTPDQLQLLLRWHGETVLGSHPCVWEVDEFHALSLTVQGTSVTASLDEKEVLRGRDERLGCGGAGFCTEDGLAGFRELVVEGR